MRPDGLPFSMSLEHPMGMAAVPKLKPTQFTSEIEYVDITRPLPYWRKTFESDSPRDKRFPPAAIQNQMLQRSAEQARQQFIDDMAKKRFEQFMKKQDQMASQFYAEFQRPDRSVFDAKGNVYRTRVDEQSFL